MAQQECLMAQMIVRNLDDKVYQRLKERAEAKNSSIEAEAREILAAAVTPTRQEFVAWCRDLRSRQNYDPAFDSTKMIREDRDREF